MLCCLGLSGFSIGATADADEDGGGIFSSILMWFQDGEADAVPEQEDDETDVAPEREDDETDVTPSHVHQATLDLIAEIEILRRATGVADDPRDAEAGEDHSATHAYAKSLEIMEKTARFQKRLGMIPVDVERMPAGNIAQKDVSRNVRAIIEELRRVKRQLVIEDEIQPAPFAGGKTPSLVYRSLRDASLLLDGLVGRPTTLQRRLRERAAHPRRNGVDRRLAAGRARARSAPDRRRERVEGRCSAGAAGHVQGHQPAIRTGNGSIGPPACGAGGGDSGGSPRRHQHPAGGDGSDQDASEHPPAAGEAP